MGIMIEIRTLSGFHPVINALDPGGTTMRAYGHLGPQGAEMQFRLEYDPLPAGAVITKIKWRRDLGTDHRACPRLPRRWLWMNVEGSGDRFGDQVGRRIEHVLIGGPAGLPVSGLCRLARVGRQ